MANSIHENFPWEISTLITMGNFVGMGMKWVMKTGMRKSSPASPYPMDDGGCRQCDYGESEVVWENFVFLHISPNCYFSNSFVTLVLNDCQTNLQMTVILELKEPRVIKIILSNHNTHIDG